MALKIITADERLQQGTVKGQIWGPAGVGKTTLLKTLDAPTTLCINVEGGLLSVQRDDKFGARYAGDTVDPEGWLEQLSIIDAFERKADFLQKYKTVFIDSTSKISQQCFEWCQTQPEAFSEKSGKPDIRGAYGLLARTMTAWASRWKFLPGVNVWLVGGLEQKEKDGITDWKPLLMGARLAEDLPYIMDLCLVMQRFTAADGNAYVGLFSDPIKNPEYSRVPIKTRVPLDSIEQPHLGKLMAKALGFSPVTTPPPSAVAV